MTTLEEIKHAIKALQADDRYDIRSWLERLTDHRYVSLGVEEPQPAYAPLNQLMALEEFLDFAEQAPLRYEYINGTLHAMAGASVAHCRIAARLSDAVRPSLRGSPCEAFATGVNLHINVGKDVIVYIPDLVVACNRDEWDERWLCNPKLVAEIHSPSTRDIDLREKAMTYRRIDSLEEYVFLEQSDYAVTVFRRAEEWRGHVYRGVDAVVQLRSVAISIPLAQIYEGTLPAHDAR